MIQNREHYACATRSSLPADQFHTETGGRFVFTWYRCKFSYRSEILAPVQEPGWTHAGVTRASMKFVVVSRKHSLRDFGEMGILQAAVHLA